MISNNGPKLTRMYSKKLSKLRSSRNLADLNEKWSLLSDLLECSTPTYETIFSYKVQGVYSLPEFWGKLQASGSVDQWYYQVKLSDCIIKEGKYNFRELTEEEKKELETKKKPPPKINKKDLAAIQAEEERIAREQKEKEDREREFQELLNSKEPEERWYFLKELPTKEPWVSWKEKQNIAQLQKTGEKFIEFEQDVNTNNGAILELDFIPSPDDDGKKRPKPKGINPEEVKPINCVTWIDFTDFHKTPGLKEITLRSKLMLKTTYEKRIDDYEARTGEKILNPTNEEIVKMVMEGCPPRNKEGEGSNNINNENNASNNNISQDKDNNNSKLNKSKHGLTPLKDSKLQSNNINSINTNNNNVNNENNPQQQEAAEISDEQWNLENNVNLDYVEKAQTYIYITIKLSNPINPVLQMTPLPEEMELIKNIEKPVREINDKEMEEDLLRQFRIAIEAIAKVYDDAMGESAKCQLVRREKGNVLTNQKLSERVQNINKFLVKFNESGRANLLKEKLKKYIVKIVREKYKKKDTKVQGVFKDKRDQFYSELYAYLTDCVKNSTEKLLQTKKDELHEDILVSYAQSKKEIMNYCVRQNKEPEDKRLLRLSKESELIDDYIKALEYYKSILLLDQSKTAWLNYLNLANKLNDKIKAEEAITNAIVSEPEIIDLNLEIVYCGMLFLKGETQKAINFMQLIVLKKGISGTSCIFNAFLAFLFKELPTKSTINFKKSSQLVTIDKMVPIQEKERQISDINDINSNNANINTNLKNVDSNANNNNNNANNNKPAEENTENNNSINPKNSLLISKNKSPNELNFQKYFEAAKMFKIKMIPPDELKPKPVEYTEEELAQIEKEKKQKEKDNKNKLSPEEEEKLKKEALKKGNPKLNPDYKPPYLNPKQVDSIWFDTINLFNKYNYYEISEKLLKYIDEESKNDIEFQITEAKIYLFRNEYEDVIEKCDLVLQKPSKGPNSCIYTAYLLKGHSYYYLKDYVNAEKNYICAIRNKPQDINFDLEMLTKLGLVYFNMKLYYDAKVIFKQILRDSVEHSFAWKYLGFVLTKLGEYDEAEKALTQANLLDIGNPTIWAYLTLYCLSTNKKFQAVECLNELNKINFRDIDLLKEIADMFYSMNEYEICANIYIKMKNFQPQVGEYYLKVADIYYNCLENKSNEAIDILKEGKENCSDEKEKAAIEKKISEYTNKQYNKITLGKMEDDDLNLNISESQIMKFTGGNNDFLDGMKEENVKDLINSPPNLDEGENENENN